MQKCQHILYFADHVFFIPTRASYGQFLCVFLADRTIFQRLRLCDCITFSPMTDSSSRISPSLQLELLMLTLPPCFCCRDSAATPLPKPPPPMCVGSGTEGKLWCKLHAIYHGQCKCMARAAKKACIRWHIWPCKNVHRVPQENLYNRPCKLHTGCSGSLSQLVDLVT